MRIFKGLSNYILDFLYLCKKIFIQFYQTFGIFIIGYINKRWLEVIAVIFGYAVCRFVFETHYKKLNIKKKTYHFKSTWVCTFTTWSIFYIITRIIPEYNVSIIIQPILGYILAYNMFIIEEKLRKGEQDASTN